MRAAVLTLGALAFACGGPGLPARPLGAGEHLAEADRHDREAANYEQRYRIRRSRERPAVECFDRAFAPDPDSGGEPIRVLRPCWTREQSPSGFEREVAAKNRRDAANHRAAASSLLAAEREACRGIGEDELTHTPFFHAQDIASVTPYREHGELRGAQIEFRKIPGLTAAWLGRALHCHQARAAAFGFSPTFMPYCPAMLEDVAVAVHEESGAIVVILRSPRDDMAAALWGRARDLKR